MHKKITHTYSYFYTLNQPSYSTYNYVQYGLVFFTAIEKRWNSQQLYKWVGYHPVSNISDISWWEQVAFWCLHCTRPTYLVRLLQVLTVLSYSREAANTNFIVFGRHIVNPRQFVWHSVRQFRKTVWPNKNLKCHDIFRIAIKNSFICLTCLLQE